MPWAVRWHRSPDKGFFQITHTNERTHDIIRGGLDRSPMYTGKIEGVGPRLTVLQLKTKFINLLIKTRTKYS